MPGFFNQNPISTAENYVKSTAKKVGNVAKDPSQVYKNPGDTIDSVSSATGIGGLGQAGKDISAFGKTAGNDISSNLSTLGGDIASGVKSLLGGGKINVPSGPTTPTPQVAVPTKGPNVTQVALPNAPTAATINFDGSKAYNPDATAAQSALIQQLLNQSQGVGPSLAENTLRQGQEANLNAVMAQLASSRGGANPLMQRQAATAIQDINAQTARDAADARLKEQMAAQGLLGTVSGSAVSQGLTARGQDIGLATGQAGLDQQAGLAGYEGALKGALANAGAQNAADQALFAAGQQAGLSNAQLQASRDQLTLDYIKMGYAADQAAAAADRQMWGTILTMAGTVGGSFFGPGGTAVGSTVGSSLGKTVSAQPRELGMNPTYATDPGASAYR